MKPNGYRELNENLCMSVKSGKSTKPKRVYRAYRYKNERFSLPLAERIYRFCAKTIIKL